LTLGVRPCPPTPAPFGKISLAEFQIGETRRLAAAIPATDLDVEVAIRRRHVRPSSALIRPGVGAVALRWSSRLWFVVAAVGQAAFIGFILAFYGVRTATGNFAGWNDKPLIDGYIKGDRTTGNFVFAAHVLLASVVTLAGLMQLIPATAPQRPDPASLDRPDLPGDLHLHGAERHLAGGRPGDLPVGQVSAVAILINGLAHPDLRRLGLAARGQAAVRAASPGPCAPSWWSAGSGSCGSA
jgi:hypothetical protein